MEPGSWPRRRARLAEEDAARSEGQAAVHPQGQGAFDLLLCGYYMWKFSNVVDACREEVKRTWDPSKSIEDICSDPDVAGSPEDQYVKCIFRKNRNAAKKFMKHCANFAASYGSGKLPGAKPT